MDILTRRAVWQKAQIVQHGTFLTRERRKDVCGAIMEWDEYGNRNSLYGWEIDHIKPYGGNDPSNLQALHWKNNLAKSDGYLVCAVTGNGNTNFLRT